MLKTRSAGQKRQCESPGFDPNREYREWIASHGDVAGDPGVSSSQSHPRVTFDDKNEILGDADEAAIPTPIPLEESVNNEWGVDGDDSPQPSVEHRERFTWRLAPSRRHNNLTARRFKESYDLDLLPFQAGSYASDGDETDYLEAYIFGPLIKGVQLEIPEEDADFTETPDDKPIQAHSNPTIATGDLASEPEKTASTPQASIETREDTRSVEAVKDIEIEFGDEPIIELSSCY